ncbi:unnamed protein product [Ectocarpus sp. CCAP 1310/34]|nr:unnamed protein product [Ectocarpus sp. CCAP 1310/34]
MVAATVRPGRPRSIDINDLHVSLGHTNDANARETAKQLGIQITGTRGYCAGCGEAKAIRRSVPKEPQTKAGRPFGRVFIDLTGPYPPSTGGARYCMMVVDDYSNVGWTLFLADKSGSTLSGAFRAWYVDNKQLAMAHGGLGVARFDNGTEFTNAEFRHLLSELGVAVEFTPVHGAKRNGRAERKIALVVEGGKVAWLEFPRLFPDLEFPRKAMSWTTIWPEALAWMNDSLNMTAQAHTPDKLCPWEKLYKRRATTLPLPFMMPGYRHHNRKNKTESKGERCFYLNTGNNHSSTTHQGPPLLRVVDVTAPPGVPAVAAGAARAAATPAAGAARAAATPAAGAAIPGSSVFPAAAVGGTAGAQELAAGAAASAAAPAARSATPGSSVFPAAAAGGTAGAQVLTAGAAASAAAPEARSTTPGSVFPAAAVREAAEAQELTAGAAASAAAPVARSATPGSSVFPVAAVGEAAGAQELTAGAAASAAAPAARSATPGSSVFPVAAVGEAAGAQELTAGAAASAAAPAARSATPGSRVFPAAKVAGTVGAQGLTAGAAASAAAPAARSTTPGSVFPAAAVGEAAEAQELAAGAAGAAAAPVASAATPGNRVFPAAAAGETAGAQALAAGAAAWTAAPAARAATAGSRVLPAAAVWEPVGTQGIAAKASAAQEPEDECDEDSCWLGHGDEGGNSSDGSGDGGIGALSAGARHPGAHPTVSNGIYVVRDDGG